MSKAVLTAPMGEAFDPEHEEYVLDSVQRQEGGYAIGCGGFGFWVADSYDDQPPHGVTPRVGDTIRFYGKGFGHAVRGVQIRHRSSIKPVFYRSPEEDEARHAAQVEKRVAEQKAEFAANVLTLNAKYDALPAEFQKRLDRFRANNPDFRWEYEPYELFCCEEAVKIAGAVGQWDQDRMTNEVLALPAGSKERESLLKSSAPLSPVSVFRALPFKRQKEVAGISDEHSGNTFGTACRLARLFLEKPELVQQEHGALCPLAGCQDYGCVPQGASDYMAQFPESASNEAG